MLDQRDTGAHFYGEESVQHEGFTNPKETNSVQMILRCLLLKGLTCGVGDGISCNQSVNCVIHIDSCEAHSIQTIYMDRLYLYACMSIYIYMYICICIYTNTVLYIIHLLVLVWQ